MTVDFKEFIFLRSGKRLILLNGAAKFFYQHGLPISMIFSEFKKIGIEISLLHMVEDFWDNGWSWETVENRLLGEIEDDIDKTLKIDLDYMKNFYDCLEQPRRKNGGWEESREMIFKYLFSSSSKDVIDGKNKEPLDFFRRTLDAIKNNTQ
jgi:hypothetical protein